MYVADSLFFIQHLYTSEDDEDHGAMFGMKLRDIFELSKQEQPNYDVEAIKDKMIEKSIKLSRK